MKVADFLLQVRLMRQHQKAYFRDRKQSDLIAAKQHETFVDRGLAEGIDELQPAEPQQATLFKESDRETTKDQ